MGRNFLILNPLSSIVTDNLFGIIVGGCATSSIIALEGTIDKLPHNKLVILAQQFN
jgi:hypothetical protein